MSTQELVSENGPIHNEVMDIDRVVNALEYAEFDPDTGYKPAALIQICINQLKRNLSVINKEIGNGWQENK